MKKYSLIALAIVVLGGCLWYSEFSLQGYLQNKKELLEGKTEDLQGYINLLEKWQHEMYEPSMTFEKFKGIQNSDLGTRIAMLRQIKDIVNKCK